MHNKWYQGSCLCGELTFQVRNIQDRIGHCHCRMCRKFHGAAFSTYGEVAQNDFEWTKGEKFISTYLAPNNTKRQFCSCCGSSLTFRTPKNTTHIEFSLNLLDDEVDVQPNAHIFTDFKANWTVITDDLACYREGRDSELKRPR
jgi:hypothetical protein